MVCVAFVVIFKYIWQAYDTAFNGGGDNQENLLTIIKTISSDAIQHSICVFFPFLSIHHTTSAKVFYTLHLNGFVLAHDQNQSK